MDIIETDKLTKFYNRKILGVKNLNLQVKEGEIFGYIGPNGAGKTTTIRLLLDLIRPTSGKATVSGLDTHKHNVAIKEEIGFLPGEIYLPDNMTGEDCLKYFAGFKKKIDKKYLSHLVEILTFDKKKKIFSYSKGNRQKLAIILAMMHQPKLLILDEPTSGLDPLNQQQFYSLLQETKKLGTTVFLSTHILTEAEKNCDRVGIIKDGHLMQIEDVDEFKEKNIHEMVLETEKEIRLDDLKIKGVKKIERTTTGYKLVTAGKNGEIIKALSHLPIIDYKIYEPSLEEIFMHFYKN